MLATNLQTNAAMHKISLSLTIFILAVTLTHAQKFTLGIKGGVNTSQLTMGDFVGTRMSPNGGSVLFVNGKTIRDNLQASLNQKTGLVGGIFMRFGKHIFVQPEFLVSTKGGSFDIIRNDRPDTPVTETIDVRYTSFDVPILFGLKGGPFRINAGPVASFIVGNNEKLNDALRAYTSGSFENAINKATYGYQLGAGLDILGFSIDVRREGTFNNLSSAQIGPANAPTQFGQKLNSWQVTLGLKLI